MPKKDFTQELKEQFTKGNLKPSQLKRSKSTENIANPNLTVPILQKSKSAEEIVSLKPSLSEQVKSLKQELVFSQNTAQNYLERLQSLEAEYSELESKVKEIKETANSKIEKANEKIRKLREEKTELVDKNNELRLQALKDFSSGRENQQGIEQAVEKLVTVEQSQINYKVQNSQLLREKSDLEQQLKRAETRIQKLYQLKGLPNSVREPILN